MNCNNRDTARFDLSFREGDTSPAWSMRFLDERAERIALADYQFYMEIRDISGQRQELRTLGSGLSVVGNRLIIEKKPQENLQSGVYTYALKMHTPTGERITFLEGKLTIKKILVYESRN